MVITKSFIWSPEISYKRVFVVDCLVLLPRNNKTQILATFKKFSKSDFKNCPIISLQKDARLLKA